MHNHLEKRRGGGHREKWRVCNARQEGGRLGVWWVKAHEIVDIGIYSDVPCLTAHSPFAIALRMIHGILLRRKLFQIAFLSFLAVSLKFAPPSCYTRRIRPPSVSDSSPLPSLPSHPSPFHSIAHLSFFFLFSPAPIPSHHLYAIPTPQRPRRPLPSIAPSRIAAVAPMTPTPTPTPIAKSCLAADMGRPWRS
jgi:hypothetical protein